MLCLFVSALSCLPFVIIVHSFKKNKNKNKNLLRLLNKNSNELATYYVPLCQHEAKQHCFLPILTMEMKATCTKSESSIVLSMEGTCTVHGHVYMYIIYSTTLIFQTLVHVSKYLNYPNTLPQFLHTHCKSVS